MKLKLSGFLKVLGFAGIVGVAGHADAADDRFTAQFTIKSLQATTWGLRVYPVGAVDQNANAAQCPNTQAYEPLPLCTATQTASCIMPETRALFERTLTAAFLAGRPVSLRINGTANVCSDVFSRPAYEDVRVF